MNHHLYATCRDDHDATPANCRADMTALMERTRLRRIAELAVDQQERRERRGMA